MITLRPAPPAETLLRFLEEIEGFVGLPYDDGKRLATIGIGINLRVRENLMLVLDHLGVYQDDEARFLAINGVGREATVGGERQAQEARCRAEPG